ncbi:RrF2 family transcriptional regulator [Endomicrobium proavitum]|uniref:Transcriptional regulator of cysteine biosynthesis n=1 Tax=Endomicrobium proavitum TaxID=1408281 RepID=A0A0G3WIF4_9BACT|nr:Rrf2 family transcriptional regulator [Endomicrobium proavitum]AKL98078.1 transcriptional regulator of cysteine biosynthesis [Endomicrobium proavitum]
MKISAKARYGLSSMLCLAQKYNTGEYITIISLSERLKISKIYLEQVFSLLKRARLVVSTKGSQGGYQLAKNPKEISAFDILLSIEAALFEKTADTVAKSDAPIEKTMQRLFGALDDNIKKTLTSISLEHLVLEAEKQTGEDGYMFYL